ncbi:unnamed protein product, partial [Coregonus sp. 'balchen']
MSKLQLFNAYLTERLTAAAAEISVAVERTITDYQEENERLRRLLDLLTKPKFHRAEADGQNYGVTEPDGQNYGVTEPTSDSHPLFAVNPGCSAAQSEASDNGMERGELLPGSTLLKSNRTWVKQGQSSHTSIDDKTATQLPHFKSPIQSHSVPFSCKVCGNTFVFMEHFIHHVRQAHTKNDDCLCGVCGEDFESTD